MLRRLRTESASISPGRARLNPSVKRSAYVLVVLAALNAARPAENPDGFATTTEPVGWRTNTFETPVNQLLTPAGIQIELPGMRPNALALSPDGSLLVTSGLKAEVLVLAAASGETLQHVPLPATGQTGPDAVSAQILGARLRDKLGYTGI